MSEVEQYKERIENVMLFLNNIGVARVTSRIMQDIIDDMAKGNPDGFTLKITHSGKLVGNASLEELQQILERLRNELENLGLGQLFVW
jgi:hypothetical protein